MRSGWGWQINATGLASQAGWLLSASEASGRASWPLLLRHIELEPSRITIVTGDERGGEEAEQYGIAFFDEPLTRENYRRIA
jgi:homospermidine synthase